MLYLVILKLHWWSERYNISPVGARFWFFLICNILIFLLIFYQLQKQIVNPFTCISHFSNKTKAKTIFMTIVLTHLKLDATVYLISIILFNLTFLLTHVPFYDKQFFFFFFNSLWNFLFWLNVATRIHTFHELQKLKCTCLVPSLLFFFFLSASSM